MRISDWSSDVCSSDLLSRTLPLPFGNREGNELQRRHLLRQRRNELVVDHGADVEFAGLVPPRDIGGDLRRLVEGRHRLARVFQRRDDLRTEENTSELQSLMRIWKSVS